VIGTDQCILMPDANTEVDDQAEVVKVTQSALSSGSRHCVMIHLLS